MKGSLMNQHENQDSEATEQRYAFVIPPESYIVYKNNEESDDERMVLSNA
jgi:hypothetical protein